MDAWIADAAFLSTGHDKKVHTRSDKKIIAVGRAKEMGGLGCSASLRSVLDVDRTPPPAPPERAFTLAEIKNHARFLEHMLLEEHVAEDRGNDPTNAFEGFRAFWPRALPSYVPPIELAAAAILGTDHALADAMENAAMSTVETNDIIASWAKAAAAYRVAPGVAPRADGPYPLLIVVGPSYWTPHAVAFLITQTADGSHECFYANTGLGAQRCGEGGRAIRITLKWTGDKIIRLIEFARRTDLADPQYTKFIAFIMKLPGYTEACVNWTPDDNADRMLTLAQYAESNGTIVSFPQRGGTCTYNCVLWLVGVVMMAAAGGKDAAVEAEKEMKKRGMRALASLVAEDAGCMNTRDCLRVMEAVAHTYAATTWCVTEVAQLRAAVERNFRTLHAAMTGAASHAVLTHTVTSATAAEIGFDMTPMPFRHMNEVGNWCFHAYTWLYNAGWRGPSRINEPIYHVFLHKAREVLLAREMPELTDGMEINVARIVSFLDRCRGRIRSETARGMLIRCARIAAAALAARHVANGTNPRACSHESRLAPPASRRSALPWVVEEHRALVRDARPLLGELIAADDPDLSVPATGADVPRSVRVGPVTFTKTASITPEMWAPFARVMQDPTRAAFNLAVLFLGAWGHPDSSDRYSPPSPFINVSGASGGITYASKNAKRANVSMRERVSMRRPADAARAFHTSEKVATYMRLSVDDMSNGRNGATSDATRDGSGWTRMAIVMEEEGGVVQSDVDRMDEWADRESNAWTQRTTSDTGDETPHEAVERMARARSMAYCASKYLEPSSREQCAIENLDAIVRGKAPLGPDALTATMGAILTGDVGPLATRMQAETDTETRLALQYAVRVGLALSVLGALTPIAADFGETIAPLIPLRLSRAHGASGTRTGADDKGRAKWAISVRQRPNAGPSRNLVFSCAGGVLGAISGALRMANVPSIHWQYEGAHSEVHEIHVNGAVIRFASTDGRVAAELKGPDARTYDIDTAPSEWSSLWYTTILAAVVPVRERVTNVLSLAVFVCTDESREEATGTDAVYFSEPAMGANDNNTENAASDHLHATQRGKHFVVPFDAAGVMPVCTPLQAHTLFCAYSRGSICAVRLMPTIAARRAELPPTTPASCIYGTYAAHALGYAGSDGEVPGVAETARLVARAHGEWCIATLEGTGHGTVPRPTGKGAATRPATPMDDVAVEEGEHGVFRVQGSEASQAAGLWHADLAPHKRRLEAMRGAGRGKWRFWFGTVVYGADERATAYLAASIAAHESLLKGHERLGVMMAKGCIGKYECAPGCARETFEAASGRFLTLRQKGLVRDLVGEGRMAVQLNMGFGKSAVIVPMLVLQLIRKKRVVIVTQPAHLVAPATRIIAAAVAASPFVRGEAILVTTDARKIARRGNRARLVVVCSSADLQGALSDGPERAHVRLYLNQKHRAHIADEIDETSDPLTCERSETVGTPMQHYDPSVDTLAYHRAVCKLVSGTESTDSTDPDARAHKDTAWYARLAAVCHATRRRKLNVNFGLVETEGVFLAVPYKYARTPVHDARYSDANAGGVLTARAVLDACERSALPASGMRALRRALEETVGTAEAHMMLELVTSEPRTTHKTHQLFMLYAVLVALPQVVCYERERVTSFIDVIGIADAFAAFSGTMAFSLPVPVVDTTHATAASDSRAGFMPKSNDNGTLHVKHDALGNALIEANIRRASCAVVPGAHDANRARSVIDLLQASGSKGEPERPKEPKRPKRSERQMVVVDASGEFGVMPQAPAFLLSGRCFAEDGTLEATTDENRRLVYFDHRNARGTDADLDADADGRVVVDWTTSTVTSVAQAMYRLRGIDYGRQAVSFIVCGAPAGAAGPAVDGDALYDRLVLNEEERVGRTVARAKIQLARASRHCSVQNPRTFVHEVVHATVGPDTGDRQQTQTQMQVQEQEQAQSRTATCLSVDSNEYYHIDPLVVYNERRVDSALRATLLATSVHVSPLLVYKGANKAPHELAFVVIRSAETARTTVGICALVEVWARLAGRVDGPDTRVAAYSARGALLHGEAAHADDVLLGTFLCGRSLPRESQIALLVYLKTRYAEEAERAAIHEVLTCLVSVRLMTPHAGLLRPLFASAAWGTPSEDGLVDPVALFVESVMSTASFGRQFGLGGTRTRPFV